MNRISDLVARADAYDKAGQTKAASIIDQALKKLAANPPQTPAGIEQAYKKDVQEVHAQAAWLKQQIDFLNRQVDSVMKTLDANKLQEAANQVGEANYRLSQILSTAAAETDIVKEAAFAKRFDVDGAKKEIKAKTQERIERDTADKWAGRALASYELFLDTKDLGWFMRAEHYLSEAREHAAMAQDDGKTLATIDRAAKQMTKRFPDKLKVEDF